MSTSKMFGDWKKETFLRENRLGKKPFGSVYYCKSLQTDQMYAVKLEDKKNSCNNLFFEWLTLEILGETGGVPKVKWYGSDNYYNMLVMELLGESVLSIRRRYKIIPIKHITNIALQCIDILEAIHSKGIIHGDIRPENLVFGIKPGSHEKLHLINFGYSTRFNTSSGMHAFRLQKETLFGTLHYSSTIAHENGLQSPKDDLISLGYTMICLNGGYFPLELDVTPPVKTNVKHIMHKMKTEEQVDLYFKDEPDFMRKFLKYSIKLGSNEVPNYKYLRRILGITLESIAE